MLLVHPFNQKQISGPPLKVNVGVHFPATYGCFFYRNIEIIILFPFFLHLEFNVVIRINKGPKIKDIMNL